MDEESMKLVWIILDARQRVLPQCPVTESAAGVWPSFGCVLRNKPIVDGPAARTIRACGPDTGRAQMDLCGRRLRADGGSVA